MKYQVVHAFSKNGNGGNPAAVVINAPLNNAEKQALARSIGHSETAFVRTGNDELFIEFFTPEKPIAYCGHATIASVNVLRELGLISQGRYVLQTQADPIPVRVTGEKVFMEQLFPGFEAVDMEEAARLLNVEVGRVRNAVIARNGVGYLLVQLENEDILYGLRHHESAISAYSEKNELIGVYPYIHTESRVLSRMFAPWYGIAEENATGMAAGLLGAWVHHQQGKEETELLIEQGFSPNMPQRGYLQVTVKNSEAGKIVSVGGEAVIKETAIIPAGIQPSPDFSFNV